MKPMNNFSGHFWQKSVPVSGISIIHPKGEQFGSFKANIELLHTVEVIHTEMHPDKNMFHTRGRGFHVC